MIGEESTCECNCSRLIETLVALFQKSHSKSSILSKLIEISIDDSNSFLWEEVVQHKRKLLLH